METFLLLAAVVLCLGGIFIAGYVKGSRVEYRVWTREIRESLSIEGISGEDFIGTAAVEIHVKGGDIKQISFGDVETGIVVCQPGFCGIGTP